jgi:hypothetical protein
MNPKYSDFLERNPTFQERIEAFTSGILTPDPKVITLWSMEPGSFYTQGELYSRVKEFAGGGFPICRPAVWSYCNGHPGQVEGSLYTVGAVVKDEIEIIETGEGPLVTVTYAKTPAGEDFGDAIAARALRVSRKLSSRYRSMARIFGGTNKSKKAKLRKGFAVYKVVKLLAQNPRKEYRALDIEVETKLPTKALSDTLNSLGDAGIIDYESPYRDKAGKRATGWAEYRLIDKSLLDKGLQELYSELRETNPGFAVKVYLKTVLKYIKDNPEEIYSAALCRRLRIRKDFVSVMLSILKNKGYLDSVFQGKRILSKTRGNHTTILLWKDLLEPIEAAADRLEPDDFQGFYEPLEFYNTRTYTRTEHIRRMLAKYDMERTNRGAEGSQEIDRVLFTLPKSVIKLSEIAEIVNRGRAAKVHSKTVWEHLARHVRVGKFEKPQKGFYRRK